MNFFAAFFFALTGIGSDQYDVQNNYASSSLSSVDFVAHFGTGHRLNRLSLANFLAERLGFGLRTFWGFCRQNETNAKNITRINILRDVEIFSYLFGSQPLRDLTHINSTNQNILFVNKIRNGFYYLHRRDLQQGRPRAFRRNHHNINQTLSWIAKNTTQTCACQSPPAQAKIKADVHLYRTLRDRFRVTPSRVQIMRDRYFHNSCLVIGLHVRAGNGETLDFARKHRYIDMNLTEWVSRVADHIRKLVRQWAGRRRGRNQTILPNRNCYTTSDSSSSSPYSILFLATDTPFMIDQFKTMLESEQDYIRVVELDQERKANGSGVWFGDEDLHERGDKCLTSWEDSFCDMILLSYADIVVASRLSTYTQTLPMSLAFATRQEQLQALAAASNGQTYDYRMRKNNSAMLANQELPPAYCEMNRDASNMQCFQSFMEWCCIGTSIWGADSIELPKDDFFHVSNYYNVTPRPIDPNDCNPKNEKYSCLPLEYNA